MARKPETEGWVSMMGSEGLVGIVRAREAFLALFHDGISASSGFVGCHGIINILRQALAQKEEIALVLCGLGKRTRFGSPLKSRESVF